MGQNPETDLSSVHKDLFATTKESSDNSHGENKTTKNTSTLLLRFPSASVLHFFQWRSNMVLQDNLSSSAVESINRSKRKHNSLPEFPTSRCTKARPDYM